MKFFRKILIFSVLSLALSMFAYAPGARAATFDPARIIDDTVFTNKNSMSVGDIQNFLNSKVPTCDTWHTAGPSAQGAVPPWTCLKDYYENISTGANNLNGAAIPSGSISAAQIIYNVAQTYNINPQVLIVTLQKENGLITDTWPYPWQYRTAMGFACPDNGSCDPAYYGFYKQVSQAARHFRNFYDLNPSWYIPFRPGVNYIQYNPNAGCGGSNVNILNSATSALYSYTPYQPNASALNNLYGTGDSCSAYGNRNFWRDFNNWFGSTYDAQTLITYMAHLSGIGWTQQKTNGGVIGTTGESRPLEAFKMNGSVEYSSYSTERGWQPVINRGMVSGTTGLSRAVNAIKINPTGNLSANYDIWYRVHVGGVGWMGWTKNNGVSGFLGDPSKKIEAIEIRTNLKSVPFYGDVNSPSYGGSEAANLQKPISLNVSSHVSAVGWQPTVTDEMMSGTFGESRRLEAINLSINNNTGLSGNIVYSTHVQNTGWQDFKSGGQISGTTGMSLRAEAVRASLVGEIAGQYTLWYRGYVENYGWMGWTKNGSCAGSAGLSLRLEAIEFRLTPVNNTQGLQKSLQSCLDPIGLATIKDHRISYSSHLSNLGWTAAVDEGKVSGTTGQSRPLEAMTFKTISSVFGSIGVACSANVRGQGWLSYVIINNTCGTTGQSRPVEAIKLRLTGDAAYLYNIKYKVHVSGVGWMDWAYNDNEAGVIGQSKNIEAVIVVVEMK